MLPNPNINHQQIIEKTGTPEINPDHIRYLLSLALIIVGIGVLLTQIFPLGNSYLQGYLLSRNNKAQYTPVSAGYLEEALTAKYFDPGISYFQNLLAQNNLVMSDTGYGALGGGEPILIDKSYKRDMRISIPRVDINNVRIASNVDSYNKKVYNEALKQGVAHFLGTPLPGDGGNSFIYGHSGIGNSDNLQVIFSRLEKVEIGDDVNIIRDDKKIEYVIIKKIIVDDSNLKVLSTIPGKSTVTLMTCWPLGIGTDRLILVAEEK